MLQRSEPTSPQSPALPADAARIQRESILVIDFGSQYSMLIARRARESNVYCEIIPHTADWESVARLNPKGVILSGGPASVYDPDAPLAPAWVYESGLPVLGICYGMQVMAHQLGGEVAPSDRKEYGRAMMEQIPNSEPLLQGLPSSMPVWMSHGDRITRPPAGFTGLARSENSPIVVMGNGAGMLGIQFHPEVVHTPHGKAILENFLYKVCGCSPLWTAGNFVSDSVGRIRERVDAGKVICALSGGVDSAVAAALVHKAVGDRLTCIFVNNGFMRKGEPQSVRETFGKHFSSSLVYADAAESFVSALRGVTDPERKRKIIGEEFIRVFDEEAARIGAVDFLAQGTLYPDVIESEGAGDSISAKIKSHHNVGGLPEHMKLSLVEPLRYLFKDEAREVGLELGLPEEIVFRQPFPRARACHTHHRRGYARKAGGAARRGRHRNGRSAPQRPLPRTMAEFRRADGIAQRGRNRRLSHIRACNRHTRGSQRRRHDRRLGAHPLRRARPHIRPHRQRSGRRQPRGV